MLQGHFVPSEQGKLFVTQFGQLDTDTAILCLPSIVEELNLARAVVAKQAQYFAQNNVPCFVMDYFGTGDSEGEFEQADVNIWLSNVIAIGHWLVAKGVKNILLWGVRYGGLLMLNFQKELHDNLPISGQLLWKPVLNGKQFFGQFIRIKQANEMMSTGAGVKKTNWRQEVLDEKYVEVAGYVLTRGMLVSNESLVVNQDFQPLSSITWLELGAKSLTPVVKKVIDGKLDEKSSISTFESPPFWQVPEIFTLPELYAESASLLELGR